MAHGMPPRFYYPKNEIAEEILRRAGFRPAEKTRGWERDVKDGGSRRLHALIEPDRIELHLDVPHEMLPDRHRTVRSYRGLANVHEEFKAIDEKSFMQKLLEALAKPFTSFRK